MHRTTLGLRLLALLGHLYGLTPAAGEEPIGLARRIPWDASRLSDSPEPPLPYTVEKTFSKHSWRSPIYIAGEPGMNRLWLVQAGKEADKNSEIVRISGDPGSAESEVLLDLPRQLTYSVCFHPAYAVNGFVYVFDNGPREEPVRRNRVFRYTVGREPPRRIDPASEEVVIEWKSAGHDGGDMAFGGDGFLYITTSDGSSDSDAWKRLFGARPRHDTFGIADAMLVAPGAPDRSVLVHRLSRRGRGQIPSLVSHWVDDRAVTLFRDWIARQKPERAFVRAWRTEDLVSLLGRVTPGRPSNPGRKLFRDAGCIHCHRSEGEGGTVGPDLDGVALRLARREVLESIVEPSKVVADEYAGVVIATEGGALHPGRVEREDDRVVVLRPPPPAEALTIPKSEIVERRRLDQSNMPAGMLNVLREEEILDLLANLLANPRQGSPGP